MLTQECRAGKSDNVFAILSQPIVQAKYNVFRKQPNHRKAVIRLPLREMCSVYKIVQTQTPKQVVTPSLCLVSNVYGVSDGRNLMLRQPLVVLKTFVWGVLACLWGCIGNSFCRYWFGKPKVPSKREMAQEVMKTGKFNIERGRQMRAPALQIYRQYNVLSNCKRLT